MSGEGEREEGIIRGNNVLERMSGTWEERGTSAGGAGFR